MTREPKNSIYPWSTRSKETTVKRLKELLQYLPDDAKVVDFDIDYFDEDDQRWHLYTSNGKVSDRVTTFDLEGVKYVRFWDPALGGV